MERPFRNRSNAYAQFGYRVILVPQVRRSHPIIYSFQLALQPPNTLTLRERHRLYLRHSTTRGAHSGLQLELPGNNTTNFTGDFCDDVANFGTNLPQCQVIVLFLVPFVWFLFSPKHTLGLLGMRPICIFVNPALPLIIRHPLCRAYTLKTAISDSINIPPFQVTNSSFC